MAVALRRRPRRRRRRRGRRCCRSRRRGCRPAGCRRGRRGPRRGWHGRKRPELRRHAELVVAGGRHHHRAAGGARPESRHACCGETIQALLVWVAVLVAWPCLVDRQPRTRRLDELRRGRSARAVVRPGLAPASISARLTHLRSVSGVMPHFVAMDVIAAHCDGYSPVCSSTRRTARSRTSTGYLPRSCHCSILSQLGASTFSRGGSRMV